MKNRFIIVMALFSGILFLSLTNHSGNKNSGQPPGGRTGAPSESTCAACHSGGDYSGEISFSLGEQDQLEYEPGETYTITFVGEYSAPRYGFSMTALDESEQPAGAFTLLNQDNTSLQTGANERQYVGHKNASANNSWSFQWTAPEQAAGNITFYYVINAADNNNGTSGDYIETGSSQVSPVDEPVTYLPDHSSAEKYLRIFPNPANEVLQIELDDRATGIRIVDLSGRIAFESHKDFTALSLNISSWRKGVYFVIIQTPTGQKTDKILIGN